MAKFAVYGTLKKGKPNHHVLGNATFLGEHTTEAKFTMHSMGSFPGVRRHGTTAIKVEVFETSSPRVIRDIFTLEGFTGEEDNPLNWYDIVSVDTPYGVAEMFYQKRPLQGPVIEDGVWN